LEIAEKAIAITGASSDETSVTETPSPPADDANRTQGVILVGNKQTKAPLQATPAEIKRMLDIIEHDILPQTESGVKEGNKVFGAAILGHDLTCDVASTNCETECPLFHGEVKCIFDWSKKTPASERGSRAQSGIFLSTHEPCCMCISSILWTGFQRIFYLLPYETTASQGIPHDINTMHELWGVNSYRKRNKYFASACIQEMVASLDEGEEKRNSQKQAERLLSRYNELSSKYHKEKFDNKRNSLVLG